MFNLRRFYPFMEADGGAGGGAAGADGEGKNADGQKTGEGEQQANLQAEAQKIADAMLAKKLRGMPSKEEVAEWKLWKESHGGATQENETRQAELDLLEKRLEGRVTAINAGLLPKYLDDAILLASARVSDEIGIEEAMTAVARANPQWLFGGNLPSVGGNPVGEKEKANEPPKII